MIDLILDDLDSRTESGESPAEAVRLAAIEGWRCGIGQAYFVARMHEYLDQLQAKYALATPFKQRRLYEKIAADEYRLHSGEHGDVSGQLEQAAERIAATPFILQNPSAIPRRAWLYGRFYARGYLSGIVSPGGVGKTALVQGETLSLVTGRDLIGYAPAKPLRVWYWNGEDSRDEIERRFAALCILYGITPADIGGRLFVSVGDEMEICIARMSRDGATICEPIYDALLAQMTKNEIDVLIIDPFIKSHAVDENDNPAADLVARTWAKLGRASNSSVSLVHHTRKLAGASSEVTIDDGRGASAVRDALRIMRAVNQMTAKEAEKVGISDHERHRFFRVDNGKRNMSPASKADWYELKSIGLGNGRDDAEEDFVQAVAAWQWPSAFADVTKDDLARVQARIAASPLPPEPGSWRADSQANAWVGKLIADVLDLDLANSPAVRAKVKELQKTWLRNGALRIVEKDVNRKPFKFIVAATDNVVSVSLNKKRKRQAA